MRKMKTMSEWKKTIKKEDNKMSPFMATREYLDSKGEEFDKIDMMNYIYKRDAREILEKIWNDNPFDENSKEFHELEKALEERYKEYSIEPHY